MLVSNVCVPVPPLKVPLLAITRRAASGFSSNVSLDGTQIIKCRCNSSFEYFDIVAVCCEVSRKGLVDYFRFCPVRFLGHLMKLTLHFLRYNQSFSHDLLSFD